jgi:hypothetical protein
MIQFQNSSPIYDAKLDLSIAWNGLLSWTFSHFMIHKFAILWVKWQTAVKNIYQDSPLKNILDRSC